MGNRFLLFIAGSFFMVLIAGCSHSKKMTTQPVSTVQTAAPASTPTPETTPETNTAPKANTEFRAAWVATVDNINWPSKKGLSTADQQKEAIALLDFLKDHHFNAVIFQVRPQADALYQSALEPWSYYLSGVQGKAPDPYYDPLQFWIDAAHERGIELHVWLNPYRAHAPAGGVVTDSSLVKKHPELVVKLKDGHWWFDPSLKGTQEHAAEVVMDIVKRYDIDGVHFDDYFYPYPSYNGNEDFPDSVSWNAYIKSGGKLSRGDWRRKSVNDFIEHIYKAIKAEKPYVKFGLSPFGMWRPGYPPSIEGFDQYNQLYADARLWLNEGWVDYFTPQLYWRISSLSTSFPVLLGWWAGENKKGRHLWPGMNVGRDTTAANTTEVINQIMVTRGMLPNSSGEVHWSIGSLTKDSNLAKAVVTGPYKRMALVPPTPWLDNKAPEAPTVQTEQQGDSLKISWTHSQTGDVFRWVVWFQYGGKWNYTICNRNDRSCTTSIVAGKYKLDSVAVTAVDRTGNESKFIEVKTSVVY